VVAAANGRRSRKLANNDLITDTLPLNRILIEALTRLEATATSEWVFVYRFGRRFKSIRSAFETACRHANLSGVTPHTLRHAFASRLGMSGVGDRALQTLGRWKEPKMIRRYIHLSEEYLRGAVEKIAGNSPAIFPTSADEAKVVESSNLIQIKGVGR